MTEPAIVSTPSSRATIQAMDAAGNMLVRAYQYDELNGYNWRITCHGIAGGLPDIRTVNSVHSGIEFLVKTLARGVLAAAVADQGAKKPPTYDHDEQCEADFIEGAYAWTECRCEQRAAAAVVRVGEEPR